MKKIILTIIVLAVIGGGSYAYYKRKGNVEPTVSTMALSRGDIAEVVSATGTLEPVETVEVGTQVSGIVQELHVDFNQFVKKGQIIAKLDPSLIQTAIERSKANVTRAKADLDRLRVQLSDAERKFEQAKGLWEKQLIPRDQFETAELNVKTLKSQIVSSEAGLVQAEADLNTQNVNLGHTIIKAPIDGVVIARNVDQGQTVAASMNAPVLYTLAEDLTKMQVLANIDEAEIGKLRMGQRVDFTVDAYPNDRFTGTVEEVRLLPTTVQNVVTYSTVISAPNPQYKLKPGMTANVTIEIARRENVLRAPAAAIRFRPTNDMFAALKQEVPADLNRGFGRGGPGGPAGAQGRAGFNGASGGQGGQPGNRPRRGDDGQNAERPGGGDRAGDRPAASPQDGSASGGRGNANLTPEQREARRKQFEQRMAGMSPEERQRWESRSREGGRTRGDRQNSTQGPSPEAIANATTIDALFAPLRPTEGRGRLWLFSESKQLRSVNVRTGITDGTWTEILDGGEASELQEGTLVVTNIVTGLEPQQRPGQQNPGSNPLMPQRGGRGPGGGGRGR
jgi:HlyD family secretion protein